MLLVSLSNSQYKRFEGKRMNEVIRALNKPPIDALFELLEESSPVVRQVFDKKSKTMKLERVRQ